MPAYQARRYCFTFWIWNGEDLDFWCDQQLVEQTLQDHEIRFLKWQIESVEPDHRCHVQGYIEFNRQKTIHFAKSLPIPCETWDSVHLESCKGSSVDNIAYVTKEECRVFGPFGFGEPATSGGRPKLEDLGRELLEHRNIRQFAGEHPGVYIQHNRGLNALLDITSPTPARRDGVVLRLWQQKLSEILAGDIHQRRVYWIWDPNGNTGKSFFVRYLLGREDPTLFLSNGRHDRIINAWQGESLIIFDFPRDVVQERRGELSDRVPYAPIEQLKNGVAWAGFAGARPMVRDIPNVVCFANFKPDFAKLSLDRWAGGCFEIVDNDLVETIINF